MAIRGQHQVPNAHFRKYWQKHVRTWLNQAGRAKSRRVLRQKKATKLSPRPIGFLRPAVRPPTVRYNFKLRLGRGFTLEELKKAGISRYQAKNLGVAVDHRRKNKCEESLATNVERLGEYKKKLLVLPRATKVKKGDCKKSELKDAKLTSSKIILPLSKPALRVAPRAITKDEKSFEAYRALRKQLETRKMFGRRLKRAADKASNDKEKNA